MEVYMKSRQLIAAVAALSAMASVGSVFAADSSVTLRDGQDNQTTSSTKAREQVRDELSQARTQGLLTQPEWAYPTMSEMDIGARGSAGARHSVRSRDEVRSELKEYLSTHNGQPMDYDREIYGH
jgi:Domain of unknown function (DUF4148)